MIYLTTNYLLFTISYLLLYTIGGCMTDDDKRLFVESIAEMRELKGELRKFKEHIIGRVSRLEKKEGEQTRNIFSALSLLVSTAALLVSVIINVIKHGGK